MYDYEVVYIQGNPNSGSKEQHLQINECIKKLIDTYTYTIIESSENNNNKMKNIPLAKVYIGFSRGSRYLKKLNKQSLKISIGGINGSEINQFLNKKDLILSGDISAESMNAHFIIEDESQEKIKLLIAEFIKNNL